MILKDGTEVAITPSTSINYGVDPEGLVKREKFCSLPFRITSLDYFYPDARIGQTLGHITVNTFKIELEDDAKEGYSKSYPGLVEGFGLKYNLYAKSELGAVLIDAGDASYIRDGKWSVSMTNMPKQKGEYFFEFVLYCTQKESYCSDNFDYETQSKLLADFVVN